MRGWGCCRQRLGEHRARFCSALSALSTKRRRYATSSEIAELSGCFLSLPSERVGAKKRQSGCVRRRRRVEEDTAGSSFASRSMATTVDTFYTVPIEVEDGEQQRKAGQQGMLSRFGLHAGTCRVSMAMQTTQ